MGTRGLVGHDPREPTVPHPPHAHTGTEPSDIVSTLATTRARTAGDLLGRAGSVNGHVDTDGEAVPGGLPDEPDAHGAGR